MRCEADTSYLEISLEETNNSAAMEVNYLNTASFLSEVSKQWLTGAKSTSTLKLVGKEINDAELEHN